MLSKPGDVLPLREGQTCQAPRWRTASPAMHLAHFNPYLHWCGGRTNFIAVGAVLPFCWTVFMTFMDDVQKKATAPQETKKWLLEFKYKVRPWGFWSKSRTRWGLPFNLASFCWLRRHRHIFFDGTGGRGRSSMLLEAKLWPLKSLPMLPFAWKILHHSRLKPQKGWHTVVDKKLH